MRRFRIKSLSVSGRKNKIHRLNDVVGEDAFHEGIADKLFREGHLELVGEDEQKPLLVPEYPEVRKHEEDETIDTTKTEKTDTDTGGGEETPSSDAGDEADDETEEDEKDSEEDKGDALESVTRKQMMIDLKSAGVDFNKNANKEELYALWKNLEK